MRKTLLSLSIVSSAIFGIASAASASPVGLRGASNSEEPGALTVDYRRCSWDGGRRLCRYGYRDHDWRYRHRDWRRHH
jgi:hypothetical protein